MNELEQNNQNGTAKIADEPVLYAASLRIGNYYNSVKFNQPVKCHLTDFYELCAASDGATDDPPINEIFEPIRLTEQILINFGFEVSKTTDKFFTKYNNIGISTANDKFIFIQGNFVCLLILTELKYVHELQNLYFALTGNELVLSGI